MKTRVLTFSQLLLTFAFCMSLTACNKDEYYEKQFLDNPYQENPKTEGPVDGGDQAGDNSGADGGAQGGANGGVGGTTGSTTGDSTTTGGTSGGDVGGTTGGTDGSVTGGTDGSTTGGSVTGGTDGSTVGGTVGGTTTGGTEGGSTTGGSTTGGTDGSTVGGTQGGTEGGSTTGGSAPVAIEEVFHQANSETKKIDIMWIIDNSGSMSDEQTNLGVNFNAFIQDFITHDVDFKMAITTTDVSSAAKKGLMVAGSEQKLNSAAAQANPVQFMTDFKNMVKVGTNGSGNEKGLEASEGFMNRYALTFLRPDAYLAVVLVSDEEDSSPKTPAFYTNFLKSFKQEAGLVKFYSIVDKNLTNTGSGITTGFQRYADASNNTAGTVSDIYDDFYTSLNDMGESIINLLDSFALANEPVDGTLKVYVNNHLVTEYSYDSASHSIKFNSGSVPAVGSEIKVQYLKQ